LGKYRYTPISSDDRSWNRAVVEVLKHNRGVELEVSILYMLENEGFNLIPPIHDSPQYRRREKEKEA
jgi:hypothetical protein